MIQNTILDSSQCVKSLLCRLFVLFVNYGTGSLGWAGTDMEYEIIRARGKSFWGVSNCYRKSFLTVFKDLLIISMLKCQQKGEEL